MVGYDIAWHGMAKEGESTILAPCERVERCRQEDPSRDWCARAETKSLGRFVRRRRTTETLQSEPMSHILSATTASHKWNAYYFSRGLGCWGEEGSAGTVGITRSAGEPHGCLLRQLKLKCLVQRPAAEPQRQKDQGRRERNHETNLCTL